MLESSKEELEQKRELKRVYLSVGEIAIVSSARKSPRKGSMTVVRGPLGCTVEQRDLLVLEVVAPPGVP